MIRKDSGNPESYFINSVDLIKFFFLKFYSPPPTKKKGIWCCVRCTETFGAAYSEYRVQKVFWNIPLNKEVFVYKCKET